MKIKHDENWLNERMSRDSHVTIDDETCAVWGDLARVMLKEYAEHQAAPLITRITELESGHQYNFHTEKRKDAFGFNIKRVWINEAASKHPASAYIDVIPSNGKLTINVSPIVKTTPENAIEFAELVRFAAGLLGD